jgi:F-type H+-transporting ATPase subunit alpha
MSVERQIAIIYCGTKGLLSGIPISKIKDFERDFLDMMETKNKEVLKRLAKGEIDDSITSALEKTASEVASRYESVK